VLRYASSSAISRWVVGAVLQSALATSRSGEQEDYRESSVSGVCVCVTGVRDYVCDGSGMKCVTKCVTVCVTGECDEVCDASVWYEVCDGSV